MAESSECCSERCELCEGEGGEVLWKNGLCRIVLVEDPHYPGFCRVILNRHVREMTDLSPEESFSLMKVVFSLEKAVREVMNPFKINLASFGNMTPHLHWHVIPRFCEDRHFPNPVWGAVEREGTHDRDPFWRAKLKTAVSKIAVF